MGYPAPSFMAMSISRAEASPAKTRKMFSNSPK
jgi:hypothetical protein